MSHQCPHDAADMRILIFLLGLPCFFLSILLLFFCWPLGLVLFVLTMFCLGSVGSGDYTSVALAEQRRTMIFGPDGPDWAGQEAPISSESSTISASAIQSMTEWGPTGPAFEVRGSSRREIPGSAEPACVTITLHSGEKYSMTGAAAERLRRRLNSQREANHRKASRLP